MVKCNALSVDRRTVFVFLTDVEWCFLGTVVTVSRESVRPRLSYHCCCWLVSELGRRSLVCGVQEIGTACARMGRDGVR
jgi:hypothetical protein